MIKLGTKEKTQEIDWAAKSWTNCIEQLDLDVDVAFFGDSITYGGEWSSYFPQVTVINLGYAGDNLINMQSRVEQLSSVKPEKIFIMAGINGLKYYGIGKTIEYYDELLALVEEELPEADIYIESILPVTEEKEENYGKNEIIVKCNTQLRALADQKGIIYIDLWSLYEKDGMMNPDYTSDGVHLQKDAYAIWVEEIEDLVVD